MTSKLPTSNLSFFLSTLLSLVPIIVVVIYHAVSPVMPAYVVSDLQANNDLSPYWRILPLSLVSGTIIGISLGLIGGGGSILAVPLLLYVVGIKDPHIAIGTSAIAVGAIALINVVQHYRKGNVRLREGIMFAIPGAIGSLIGSQLGLLTPANGLLIMFALLMTVIAIKMLSVNYMKVSKFNSLKAQDNIGDKTRINSSNSSTGRNLVVVTASAEKKQQWRLTLTGLGVGLAAGYFGIGGGFLIVPSLIYAGGLAISTAIGTSLIPISTFGFMTASRYSFEGLVNVPAALILIVGGIGGSLFGTKIGSKLEKVTLTKIFAIMLIVVAVYMIAKSLTVL
jgi:uncharacterized protein